MSKLDKLIARNSTAEFLIFEKQTHANGIEVVYKDGTLWLTQKMITELFDVQKAAISKHLKNIYESGELDKDSTVSKMETVQNEGAREISRNLDYYNLDVVISIGYRVNSVRATRFRRWATAVLSKFAQQGYLIDRKRMENGTFLDEDYFEHLLEEIREIRLSERRFYQKITDIYATSIDYDKNSVTTKSFFSKVQNKMHYAITKHTAAEIIYDRTDSTKQHMGLTTWEKAPDGKIIKSDVTIAKNYLSKEELEDLGRIVNAFLELAESAAKRHIPLTMEDWANRIDKFLLSDDRDILKNSGSISMEIAKDKAETEFEKYRIIQDKLFESDFDHAVKQLMDKKGGQSNE